MKKIMKGILAGILGVTACCAAAGCNDDKESNAYGSFDMGAYEDLISGVMPTVETFDHTDEKIALSALGEYSYQSTKVRVNKIEYSGEIITYSGIRDIKITFKFSCTALEVKNGKAELQVKLYDSEGYLLESETLYQYDLSVGDKFILTYDTYGEEDWASEYEKGMRLEIVNV